MRSKLPDHLCRRTWVCQSGRWSSHHSCHHEHHVGMHVHVSFDLVHHYCVGLTRYHLTRNVGVGDDHEEALDEAHVEEVALVEERVARHCSHCHGIDDVALEDDEGDVLVHQSHSHPERHCQWIMTITTWRWW